MTESPTDHEPPKAHPEDAEPVESGTAATDRAGALLPAPTGPKIHERRGSRRSLAQREAAAKQDLATLATERRRLRTRGAIVAGGLLARVLRQRKDLKPLIVEAVSVLQERDREAIALFAPELLA